MSDWIHGLSIGWLVVVVFAVTFVVTGSIYWVVMRLATGDRARAFKGISPGLLPPLGMIFGLLIAFIAAQVWSDDDRANAAVNHEASALRGVVLLARAFPPEADAELRGLVAAHIREVTTVEWPAMADRQATLSMVPTALADALTLAFTLPTTTAGQIAAQREIVAQLENALDARRQRILLSRGGVNWVKWTAMILPAICTLIGIALVHSDNRTTAKIALGLFATAAAVCVMLVIAHDRPFSGKIAVGPSALLQVQPESGTR